MTYQPKLPPLDPCPVEHVVHLIGGRWKARLLGRVREAACTVAELQRFVPRAKPQVLLRQLKVLEQDGLIERLPLGPAERWGRYALTERGATLLAAVDHVAAWGQADLAPDNLVDGDSV
jgi:DNA-binding HxlR family transcriptional regulator